MSCEGSSDTPDEFGCDEGSYGDAQVTIASLPSQPVLVDLSSDSGEDNMSIVPYEGVVKDIEPLRMSLVDAESSGEPSISEPTHILPKNHASRIDGRLMRGFKLMYRFPESIEVRALKSFERIDYKIPGWIGFYERPLRDGFRFPVPRLAWEVLDHFGISPSQLMPNAWRVLMAVECMAHRLDMNFSVGDLMYSYYLKEHLTEKGRYLLISRPKMEPLVHGLTTNDRGDWQKYYFFVRGAMVFGLAGPGRIPEHWETSSECFLFFCFSLEVFFNLRLLFSLIQVIIVIELLVARLGPLQTLVVC